MAKTTKEWEKRLQSIANDAGKGDLHPVYLALCADALRQWEQLTEELATRPELVDEAEKMNQYGGWTERSVPPEFTMQSKLIQTIRGLLKDMGLVDLSVDPLAKIKRRLGVGVN